MASVVSDPGGRRRILFVQPDGTRPAIRLGKVSKKDAESFARRVEQLQSAKLMGRMDPELAAWVAERDDKTAAKLARVGLIEPRGAKGATTLGAHLESYFAKRTDVKPNTLTHWNHTRRLLLAYFGDDRPLGSITAGEAKDWERWLRTGEARANRYGEAKADEGLAVNTARKRVGNAKQFFADAVSRDLLAKNPFDGLKGAVGSNRERDYFIDRDTAAKVMEACPDDEWRLIFALSRYAGLRCPSEHLALTWGDVNWAEGRMLIHASKTAHHEGKGTRVVPIFPELRPYLEKVWDAAAPGTIHVVARCRGANQNLRTQLERIIRRAGLEPWPKLFQNLRSSRATELANEYPAHVAAAWLGHSTLVANKHYWQVTDEHFAKALDPGKSGDEKSGAESGARAAQNRAQQVTAENCQESQSRSQAQPESDVMQGCAVPGETSQKCLVNFG